MTIREAFEKAGYPVPEGARILCFNQSPSCDDSKDWRHAGLYDRLRIPQSGVFRPCHRGVWAWDSTPGSWNGIDLSELPAIAAYDALPIVVQEVVKK